MLDTNTVETPHGVETPRETRLRLNRLERWVRDHVAALTDAGHGPALVRLRGLFEWAITREHADYLADEIRDLTRHVPAGHPVR